MGDLKWVPIIGRVLYRLATLWLLWLIAYWCFRIAMALQGEPEPVSYASHP